jgi:hypothetical protein
VSLPAPKSGPIVGVLRSTDNRSTSFKTDKNVMKVRIADKITVMENFDKFKNSSSIEVSSAATRALLVITSKCLK